MAIRVQIIIVNKLVQLYINPHITDLTEDKNLYDPQHIVEYNKIRDIVTAISNLEIVDVIISRPITNIIMKRLLSISANNKADVVFITGNIDSTDKEYINEAIKTIIINPKELFKNLTISMSIEKHLKSITSYGTLCGIRNKTLIIHLPGTHDDICVASIANTLIDTVHLICKEDDQKEHKSLLVNKYFPDSSDSNDSEQKKDEDAKENVSEILEKSSSPFASNKNSSDNFSEQRKDKSANENLYCSETSDTHKSSASSTLSTESINYNASNCHTEWTPLISFEDAVTKIVEIATASMTENTESVKISDAHGRILCEDICAKYNVPPFRTSKKHGYAVLVSDGKGMRQVLDDNKTFPPISVQRGTCVWVKSGAPVPNEATAIVEEKDTKRIEPHLDDDKVYIEIMSTPQHGQNINPIGYNIRKAKIILQKYTRIGPEEIGVLAASGYKEVTVAQPLSIGILSIGNNLEEPGKPLKPGYIYDINRITLISLLKDNDFSSSDFGIVNNTPLSIRKNIEEALHKVDILVTSGFANDKDLLKRILVQYFEAEIYFGNVNIKPGKSTTLATCKIDDKTKYFLCLSGNPVTAFIVAQVFLLPFLRKMSCNAYIENPILPVYVDNPFILHHRPRFAYTYLKWSDTDNIAVAYSMGNLSKDKLCNIVGSNALLLLPESKTKQTSKDDQQVPGLLIDCPGKYKRSLSNLFNKIKVIKISSS